jgi:hypothetical protein
MGQMTGKRNPTTIAPLVPRTLQRKKSLPYKLLGQASDGLAGREGRAGDLKVRARERGKANALFHSMFVAINQTKSLQDGIARNGWPETLAQVAAVAFTETAEI